MPRANDPTPDPSPGGDDLHLTASRALHPSGQTRETLRLAYAPPGHRPAVVAFEGDGIPAPVRAAWLALQRAMLEADEGRQQLARAGFVLAAVPDKSPR